MTIINLTPHTLNIHCSADDDDIYVVPPSGTVARVATVRTEGGMVDGDIPFSRVEFGAVEDLPERGEDILVVSGMVASACPRTDVFSPGELVRDDAGRPVGCRGLTASC